MVKEIKGNEFEELLSSGATFVCDFWASWCGPCRMLAPVVDGLSGCYPSVPFVKVDVDEEGELASRYGVMSIPFVAVFKEGRLAAKSIGYLPEEELKLFFDSHL